METVHIALPSDQNYVPGLVVTAGSIAHFASKDVNLIFHILDGGINDDTFNDMARKIKRLHPHVDFHRIGVNENLFINYPSWSGNKMTYARLLLSEALPDVSHIIYSDTDFLWLIDIVELWREHTPDRIFISAQDCAAMLEKESEWNKMHGLNFDCSKYFCAGLSFYNLDKFRTEKIPQKVAEFLIEHPDVPYADQTALNHLLFGRVHFMPRYWQTPSFELTGDTIRKPVAIHFTRDLPWTRRKHWAIPISDSTLLWHAMADYINCDRPGTSLKGYHTLWQRTYKRSLAHVFTYSCIKGLLRFVHKKTRRGTQVLYYSGFAINLHITPKDIRKILKIG